VKVVISKTAERELEEISDWIARDSPKQAVLFVKALRHQAMALGEQPRAFPLLPRAEVLNIRRCVFRGYLIFYRIHQDRAEILHILHGARDVDRLLFP
jgi:toxin ParE1/3/4